MSQLSLPKIGWNDLLCISVLLIDKKHFLEITLNDATNHQKIYTCTSLENVTFSPQICNHNILQWYDICTQVVKKFDTTLFQIAFFFLLSEIFDQILLDRKL